MSHSISNFAFNSLFVLATKNKSNTTSNTINKIQNTAPYKQISIKEGNMNIFGCNRAPKNKTAGEYYDIHQQFCAKSLEASGIY